MMRAAGQRVARQAALLCCFALAFAACGDGGGDAAPGEPVSFRPRADGATPFGDIPWPSDLYLDEDGTIAEIAGLERLVEMPGNIVRGLSRLDGFGRSTGAIFFVDSDVDPDRLPRTWEAATADDAAAFFADVDPDSPAVGTRYPAYAKFLPTLDCITMIPVPGIVLPPGVRHAAVVTTRVRTRDGGRLVADAELERIAHLNEHTTPIEQLYGDAVDRLVEHGNIDRADDVAGLAVFTTSRRIFELPELRARLAAQPEPELLLDAGVAAPFGVAVFGAATDPSIDDWLGDPAVDEDGFEWPGTDNPTGIAHDAIAVVASGAFTAPSYIDQRTRHIERDGESGEFRLAQPDARIPVTLILPRQPPPPGGYPVVIHGHGLSNHRGSMLGIANELARAGFAMIGIDDVLHGARAGAPDVLNNFRGPYAGPDGIPDTYDFPVSFFAAFADFAAMEDNFRQTVLDQTSLVRLIRSSRLDLSPLTAAAGDGVERHLDATRIYWSGGSLGGIIGAMTIAVEPEIDAAALQAPGASFIQMISTNSAELAFVVEAVAGATLALKGEETNDEFHPVAMLLATATEAGDPIAYAPHVFDRSLALRHEAPDVLVTYAPYDEVLPNLATHALIRALGLELTSPAILPLPGVDMVDAPVAGNLASGATGAAVQYMPANHNLGYSRFDTRKFEPNFEADGSLRPPLPEMFTFEQPVREHAGQLVAFLTSATAGEPARIEITAAPIPDYDGDGALDADEESAGSDPYDPRSAPP